jgi:hypothetical protein
MLGEKAETLGKVEDFRVIAGPLLRLPFQEP